MKEAENQRKGEVKDIKKGTEQRRMKEGGKSAI